MSIQQKIPLSRSLPQLAARAAEDAQEQVGLRLPGHVTAVSGSIVTVNFDVHGVTLPQATMAVAMSQYDRIPIQVNDKGYATTADAFLGGATGLGNGTADLTQWGNLSNLVWVPISNKNWTAFDSTARVITSANGQFVVSCGNSGVTISYNGTVLFKVDTTNVTINNRVFLNHDHSAGTYVAPSGGGPVTGDSGTVV